MTNQDCYKCVTLFTEQNPSLRYLLYTWRVKEGHLFSVQSYQSGINLPLSKIGTYTWGSELKRRDK